MVNFVTRVPPACVPLHMPHSPGSPSQGHLDQNLPHTIAEPLCAMLRLSTSHYCAGKDDRVCSTGCTTCFPHTPTSLTHVAVPLLYPELRSTSHTFDCSLQLCAIHSLMAVDPASPAQYTYDSDVALQGMRRRNPRASMAKVRHLLIHGDGVEVVHLDILVWADGVRHGACILCKLGCTHHRDIFDTLHGTRRHV